MAALLSGFALGAPSSSSSSSACTQMDNSYNTQYSAEISIGSKEQKLLVIPDTGSFELVIPSTFCNTSSCMVHERFNPYESKTYTPNPPDTAHKEALNYGQGGVVAIVGYDDVHVGSATAKDQIINLMYDETIRGYDGAEFDGIMGMGKNEDADGSGGSILGGSPALMTNMGMGSIGVCLSQIDEENGRLDLASSSSQLPSLYSGGTTLTSIGDYHWGLRLSGMGIKKDGEEDWLEGDEGYGCSDAEKSQGSCKSGDACDSAPNCAAVIDTGTSLMLLADNSYYALLDKIEEAAPGKMDELYGQTDCSGASALPSVMVKLGEEKKPLEIKPEVYMATMPLPLGVDLKEWRATKQYTDLESKPGSTAPEPAGFVIDRCVDLFSTMDGRIMTQYNGLMYILGMPLFRQFAVSFDRDADPHTISFADVSHSDSSGLCNGCKTTAEGVDSMRASARTGGGGGALLPPQGSLNATRRGLRIDPSKVRYPTKGYHSSKRAGVPVKL